MIGGATSHHSFKMPALFQQTIPASEPTPYNARFLGVKRNACTESLRIPQTIAG